MKCVAAVFADFDATFLGGPSRLTTRLGSRSLLGHLLARLRRVDHAEHRCLVVRPQHESIARAQLKESGADDFDLLTIDHGQRPHRGLMRSARKWHLESWRGGVYGATYFDEFVEPTVAGRVLNHYEAGAVLCVDGHCPALDPQIAGDMFAQARTHSEKAKMVFTQAPPGIAGVVLRPDVIADLVEQSLPIGMLLTYRPEMPCGDPITRDSCLQIDAAVAQTAARLTGDTRRSLEILEEAFGAGGEDIGASDLCAWLAREQRGRADRLPVEVELELTTDDPLPDTRLRLRGARVPTRRLSDPADVGRLAEQLAEYDDRLCMLGGFGDPLLHPQFAQICKSLRTAGVCGIGVATPLVELTDENLNGLIENGVDIVQVLLDAASPGTYRTINNADQYDRVRANIERIQALRRDRVSPQPLVVCSLTRCAATLADMEPFFDGWIPATGSALITGYNTYCGELPEDTLLPLEPPLRKPCRRLDTRMTLLADGAAVRCSQDVSGQTRIGDWTRTPLSELWRGTELASVRSLQRALDLDGLTLCGKCREWFRP